MADEIILDAGQDPGAQAAIVAAQAVGARGWLAFSGGRSLVFPPWSAATVQGLLAVHYGILPVYAMATPLTQAQGIGDGQTAAAEWQAWGISPGALGMLDVEPDFYNLNPVGCLAYANAWQQAVHQAGYLSCMYGLANFIDAFQSTPPSADAVIVANYPLPRQLWGPPSTADIPGVQATWPQRRGWQYTNDVTVGGVTVDVSVINFSLARQAGQGGRDGDMGLWIRNQDNGEVAVIDAAGVRFNPAEFNARVAYAAAANIPPYVNLSTADFNVATAGLPDLAVQAAKIAGLSTPTVDVNALATALSTHPLTATLSDAERDAIATHVLQHLSRDTSAG